MVRKNWSSLKLLESLKGQISDARNLALTKRSVMNCTMIVWQKHLMKTLDPLTLMAKKKEFSGKINLCKVRKSANVKINQLLCIIALYWNSDFWVMIVWFVQGWAKYAQRTKSGPPISFVLIHADYGLCKKICSLSFFGKCIVISVLYS